MSLFTHYATLLIDDLVFSLRVLDSVAVLLVPIFTLAALVLAAYAVAARRPIWATIRIARYAISIGIAVIGIRVLLDTYLVFPF